MKITKKQLIISLASIVIVLISLGVTICDFVLPLNLWTHPILTFLFSIAVGFGTLCLCLGLCVKSAWYLFISAILYAFAIIYPFAHYPTFWWLGLIITVVVWSIIAIICYVFVGFKTEAIALNKSSDYKNYEQRKAEKLEAEANKEPEEMPEIKSFK